MSNVSNQQCVTGHHRIQHLATKHFRKYTAILFEALDTAFSPQDPDQQPVTPQSIQAPLYQMLHVQLEAAPSCEARDVQMVMAGLTDDLFLNKEWFGRTWWRNNPIEYRLFETRSAGDYVFSIVDRLVEERDPESIPLAQIIMDAFALGFKGRYAGEAEIPPSYLSGLTDLIHAGCTTKNPTQDTMLFPEAYKWTLSPSSIRELPTLRSWLVGTGAVALLLLIISHVVWSSNISPLEELLNKLNL